MRRENAQGNQEENRKERRRSRPKQKRNFMTYLFDREMKKNININIFI